jgi:hypothetical protein
MCCSSPINWMSEFVLQRSRRELRVFPDGTELQKVNLILDSRLLQGTIDRSLGIRW